MPNTFNIPNLASVLTLSPHIIEGISVTFRILLNARDTQEVGKVFEVAQVTLNGNSAVLHVLDDFDRPIPSTEIRLVSGDRTPEETLQALIDLMAEDEHDEEKLNED